MSSCLNSEAAMLLNIASRCALVRLNLRPDFWWRMDWFPFESWNVGLRCRHPGVVTRTAGGPYRPSVAGIAARLMPRRRICILKRGRWRSTHHAVRGDARRRPVFQLHAERKAALCKHFLDLGERLLAEVRRLEQFDFRLLDQVADVIDAFGLEAVGRTHRQLEVVDRAQQYRIHAARLRLRRTAVAVGEI